MGLQVNCPVVQPSWRLIYKSVPFYGNPGPLLMDLNTDRLRVRRHDPAPCGESRVVTDIVHRAAGRHECSLFATGHKRKGEWGTAANR